jgi:ADP-ribosylation factor-like protein 8
VDSADTGNLDVSKIQLQQLLTSQSLEGIPLLVLGNKNDLESAYNEEKLCTALDLNTIKDRTVAVYSVSCKNMINIENVLTWLSKVKSKK